MGLALGPGGVRSTGVVAKGNPSAREIQMPVYEGQLAYFVADI